MIEDLEADLIVEPINDSNTGDKDLAEVTNNDKAITAVAKAINET